MMGISVQIPGVVGMGSVLGAGSVGFVLSVVAAGEVVLVPPVIGPGQGRTPGSRTGPRLLPGLVGIRAMVSVAL